MKSTREFIEEKKREFEERFGYEGPLENGWPATGEAFKSFLESSINEYRDLLQKEIEGMKGWQATVNGEKYIKLDDILSALRGESK